MASIAAQEWGNAGQQAGMEIWRIEALRPVPVPKEHYGHFYSGDSYIVLVTLDARGRLSWNIHFWLGKESSQDEMGIAAKKTVELDDYLGGAPKQYREVQEHESLLFLSYFRDAGGIEYLPGGVASGFNHVEPEVYPTRLLHVKGSRNVRMAQVELKASSLNKGDVFILDDGMNLYLWNGPTANNKEMAKGVNVVHRLRDARGAKPVVHVLRGDETAEASAEFWAKLGGSFADVGEATDDDAADAQAHATVVMYKVVGGGDVEAIARDAAGHYTRDMLNSESVMLIDSGSSVFVWVGLRAPKEHRAAAVEIGNQFLTKNGRPSWTAVQRIVEKGETPEFKEFFYFFDPPVTRRVEEPRAEKRADDLSALYGPGQAPSEKLVDDGTGTVTVWRIEDMELAEVPARWHGHFYSGDSYVILYKYNRDTCSIVYFWQGRNSSTDEKGASALHATKVAGRNGNAPQVRVTQGKEPAHFCAIFKSRMVVHSGGVKGRFDSDEGAPQADVRLYHIRGTTDVNTRATEVEAKATSLNSGDAFILLTPTTAYAWLGEGSIPPEKALANAILTTLAEGRAPVVVDEKSEPEEFWSALGGKAEYPSEAVMENIAREPRLFHITDSVGFVKVEEVYNFSQDDLDRDDVMLLDLFTQVFVWIGPGANQHERDVCMDIAGKYIAGVGRDEDTPIIRVEAGTEPPMFTCNFLGWDANKAKVFEDPYEASLRRLKENQQSKAPFWASNKTLKSTGRVLVEENKEENSPAAGSASPAPTTAAAPARVAAAAPPAPAATATPASPKPAAPPAIPVVAGTTFPYAQLRSDSGVELPVDPLNREAYLSDAEFATVLGMAREEFAKLPKWRQQNKKKETFLF